MEKISIIKAMIFLGGLALFSCSSNEEKNDPAIEKCHDPNFLLEIVENIPATVSIVQEGEPFYHGIRNYYEVDAETYIPELFEQNGQKSIRIFPTSQIDEETGDRANIKGKLSTCVTGNHGLSTFDYKKFYILEN